MAALAADRVQVPDVREAARNARMPRGEAMISRMWIAVVLIYVAWWYVWATLPVSAW